MTKLYLYNIKDNNIDSSLKAHELLTEILKEDCSFELKKEDIIKNKYGKPYIKDKDIYFSISHSLNMIALLIAKEECGVDIQYVDNNDHDKLAKKILSKKEYETYKLDKEIFFKKWTQIEAYYKKIGTGLKYNKLDLLLDEEISVYKIKDSKDNLYYLASSIDCEIINI